MEEHTKEIIDFIKKQLNQGIKDYKINVSNIQQRGIGDKIEDFICSIIQKNKNSSSDLIIESATSRRSIEDIQIKKEDYIYKLDIKSHNVDSDFSMPNLISIDRLKNFYQNNKHFIIYIFANYKINSKVAIIQNIDVRLIEELDWGMLAIQNLGKGQLQIKNMNNKLSFVPVDRESWMAELKENAIIYYDKLINKINNYKKTWS